MKKLFIFFVSILIAGTGCKKMDEQPIVASSYDIVLKNMLICNNLNALNKRISRTDNTDMYFFKDIVKGDVKNIIGTKSSSVSISQIANILPPKYKDEVLQASHIRIAGDYAYIAYNTQGLRYLGGVDIVDISSPCNPELISSVIFINQETNKGKDISSVDALDLTSAKCYAYVWITGADETRDSAFAERYELNQSHQFDSVKTINVSLKGRVGTDVRYYNDKVYVTSGTGGGITALDDQMKEVSYIDLINARSVDVNKNFTIALGGNPGHLYNLGLWDKEIGGASDPEAKSILRLYSNYALVALCEEGLKCYDVSSSTPSLISSLPRPIIPEGKAEWDYVTNGVSVSDDGWVYIANGAGGLDVAKIGTDGQLTRLGNIDLGASVNFVEANSKYLFVATGLGGLMILQVTEN
jgi:hypothetical protein